MKNKTHNNNDLPSKKTASNTATTVAKSTGKVFVKILTAILSIFFTFFIIFSITGIIVASVFANYCKNYLVEDFDLPNLKLALNMTTSIFSKNRETGKYFEIEDQRLYGTENRLWASIQDMPKNLTNAFVAIEDERFYEHKGVDWRRTIGATLDFASGKESYGGSTITQQLIKNATKDNETTIQRKVQEIFRAISLTKKRSKDEVIEMYLNTINLSRGKYGVKSAANYYFGKEVSELSLVECAALASIPKSPTKYDPVRNPEENKLRRNVVLTKMHDLHWISDADFEIAVNSELVLNITVTEDKSSIYSYFTDALIEQLIEDLEKEYGYSREIASNYIFNGGLQVYSTVDTKVQDIMENVFEDPETFPKSNDSSIIPQSAMVVMDPNNGDVVGIIGGVGKKEGNRSLNRATKSTRQIGSSIKPISVYAPAMDIGLIKSSSYFEDSPFEYNKELGRNWPVNAPNRYDGTISLNTAIIKSKNTVAVKVLDKLTPAYSYDFLTKKLGISTLVDSDKDLAPLALGGLTYGMTVMEVTAAYSIFPSGGIYSSPRLYEKVLDSEGNEILVKNPQKTAAISEGTAQVMTKYMQNVLTSGTGTAVTLKNKVNTAGKTGSTNADKDRYFVGYTPYYVSGCWFGADIPIYLGSRFSGNPALKAWDKVMNKIHDYYIERDIKGIDKLKTFDYSATKYAEFCPISGDKPGVFCNSQKGLFAIGTEPTKTCNSHGSGLDWEELPPPPTGADVTTDIPSEPTIIPNPPPETPPQQSIPDPPSEVTPENQDNPNTQPPKKTDSVPVIPAPPTN